MVDGLTKPLCSFHSASTWSQLGVDAFDLDVYGDSYILSELVLLGGEADQAIGLSVRRGSFSESHCTLEDEELLVVSERRTHAVNAAKDNDSLVLAWQTIKGLHGAISVAGISGATGEMDWLTNLETPLDSYRSKPQIASVGGGAFVAWEEWMQELGSFHVKGALLDPSGAIVKEVIAEPAEEGSWQSNPELVAFDPLGYVLAWYERLKSEPDAGAIRMMLFDTSGNQLAAPVSARTLPTTSEEVQLRISLGSSTSLFAWLDGGKVKGFITTSTGEIDLPSSAELGQSSPASELRIAHTPSGYVLAAANSEVIQLYSILEDGTLSHTRLLGFGTGPIESASLKSDQEGDLVLSWMGDGIGPYSIAITSELEVQRILEWPPQEEEESMPGSIASILLPDQIFYGWTEVRPQSGGFLLYYKARALDAEGHLECNECPEYIQQWNRFKELDRMLLDAETQMLSLSRETANVEVEKVLGIQALGQLRDEQEGIVEAMVQASAVSDVPQITVAAMTAFIFELRNVVPAQIHGKTSCPDLIRDRVFFDMADAVIHDRRVKYVGALAKLANSNRCSTVGNLAVLDSALVGAFDSALDRFGQNIDLYVMRALFSVMANPILITLDSLKATGPGKLHGFLDLHRQHFKEVYSYASSVSRQVGLWLHDPSRDRLVQLAPLCEEGDVVGNSCVSAGLLIESATDPRRLAYGVCPFSVMIAAGNIDQNGYVCPAYTCLDPAIPPPSPRVIPPALLRMSLVEQTPYGLGLNELWHSYCIEQPGSSSPNGRFDLPQELYLPEGRIGCATQLLTSERIRTVRGCVFDNLAQTRDRVGFIDLEVVQTVDTDCIDPLESGGGGSGGVGESPITVKEPVCFEDGEAMQKEQCISTVQAYFFDLLAPENKAEFYLELMRRWPQVGPIINSLSEEQLAGLIAEMDRKFSDLMQRGLKFSETPCGFDDREACFSKAWGDIIFKLSLAWEMDWKDLTDLLDEEIFHAAGKAVRDLLVLLDLITFSFDGDKDDHDVLCGYAIFGACLPLKECPLAVSRFECGRSKICPLEGNCEIDRCELSEVSKILEDCVALGENENIPIPFGGAGIPVDDTPGDPSEWDSCFELETHDRLPLVCTAGYCPEGENCDCGGGNTTPEGGGLSNECSYILCADSSPVATAWGCSCTTRDSLELEPPPTPFQRGGGLLYGPWQDLP